MEAADSRCGATADLRFLVKAARSPGQRRRWTVQEKVRIVAESYDPATTVTAVARRYDINRNQLFIWRRQLRDRIPPSVGDGSAGLSLTTRERAEIQPAPLIELVVGQIVVRVQEGVDATVLRRVLQVVRGLS